MPSNVVSNKPGERSEAFFEKMPFVLDNEAWKGVMKHDRAVGIGGFEPRPAFVLRAGERSCAARHMEVPVVGVHEARSAKHPDNGVDGSVVLADQGKLIDGSEDDRGRALINRVVGQQERQRDAMRRRRIFPIPVTRVIEANNADASGLEGIAAHAGGASAARADAQLVVGFERFLVAVGSAPGGSGRLGVALRRIQKTSIVRVAGQRDRRHAAESLRGPIGSIPRADPKSNFKRRTRNAPTNLHQFRICQDAHEPARLLQGKQAQGVAHERRHAAVLSPQAVEKNIEDEQPEESFGLAAARREIKKAGR